MQVVVDAEQESPPQVRQCGELDLDCRQTDKAVKTDEEMEAIQNGVVEMEAGKEEEDDVPSFEEFKQKMIEQGVCVCVCVRSILGRDTVLGTCVVACDKLC